MAGRGHSWNRHIICAVKIIEREKYGFWREEYATIRLGVLKQYNLLHLIHLITVSKLFDQSGISGCLAWEVLGSKCKYSLVLATRAATSLSQWRGETQGKYKMWGKKLSPAHKYETLGLTARCHSHQVWTQAAYCYWISCTGQNCPRYKHVTGLIWNQFTSAAWSLKPWYGYLHGKGCLVQLGLGGGGQLEEWEFRYLKE